MKLNNPGQSFDISRNMFETTMEMICGVLYEHKIVLVCDNMFT